jgi:hypothetical protein
MNPKQIGQKTAVITNMITIVMIEAGIKLKNPIAIIPSVFILNI